MAKAGDRLSKGCDNPSDNLSPISGGPSSTIFRAPSFEIQPASPESFPASSEAPASSSGLSVLLYQPEIPPNTGNIARTCAATRTPLYLVEPLGFSISDKQLKRAGLDYWEHVPLKVFPDFDAAIRGIPPSRMIYFSARASRIYIDFSYRPGDCLVFGPETRGLPDKLIANYPGVVVKIPIDSSRVRSLNLSTSVGIALFEAIRQLSAQNSDFDAPTETRSPGSCD